MNCYSHRINLKNQVFADYLYAIPSHWKMDRNPTASVEKAVKIWGHKVRPSLESLEKMVEDDLIAGQRRGIFIADASSHDEIANMLSDLPLLGQN